MYLLAISSDATGESGHLDAGGVSHASSTWLWLAVLSAVAMQLIIVVAYTKRLKKKDRIFSDHRSLGGLRPPPAVTGAAESKKEQLGPNFSFKFQHQSVQEQPSLLSSPSTSTVQEAPATMTTIRKFRSLTEKDFCAFVEAPKTMTISVHDEPADQYPLHDKTWEHAAYIAGFLTVGDFGGGAGSSGDPAQEFGTERGVPPDAPPRVSSGVFSGFESDSESSVSDSYSVKDLVVDSDIDCFLSDGSLGVNSDHDNPEEEEELPHAYNSGNESVNELVRTTSYEEQIKSANKLLDEIWANVDVTAVDREPPHSGEETAVTDDDEPEQGSPHGHFQISPQKPLLVDEDRSSKRGDPSSSIQEAIKNDMEKLKERDWSDFDGGVGENDELESLWEHQDLIEQLRMEIKKARTAVGLPTILEESESQKDIEELDLPPLRITDAAFIGENPTAGELHQFYKCYMERMRKLDMLIYQKNTTIGILRLEGMLQSLGSKKPLLPTVMSVLTANLQRPSRRRAAHDPLQQLLKDLRCDLEAVYVGQTCLSWEFLRWQYENSPEFDSRGSHHYDYVAGEFQQFQVLVQRFTENERFNGPRLERYIQLRGDYHKILQVPVIKESVITADPDSAITSAVLEERMYECVVAMWEFIKADKAETPAMLKGLRGSRKALERPEDYELFSRLHAELKKRLKRLRDLQKSGNCLVKKFKRPTEDRSNRDMFFAEVDMRLVSRVLTMPRISTEQLRWCSGKLEKIKFINRSKIHREREFLPFPC